MIKYLDIFIFESLYQSMLTDLEKKVIASIQGDIPVTERPFYEIGRKIGVSEDTVLKTLISLKKRGIIRRFGATIRHQKSGFKANAMVAWIVDEDKIDKVGEKMALFKEVTHCYRRDPHEKWPYNLYTMVHGKDKSHCYEIAEKLSNETGEKKYSLLFSQKELKKTSMQYFPEILDN